MIDYASADSILENYKDVYEQFTFDYVFRKLIKLGVDKEEAMDMILQNCSLSALVFQERVHNGYYRKISTNDMVSKDLQGLMSEYCKTASISRCVGQMSDLIQEFDGRSLEEWAVWYQERYPNAVAEAIQLIRNKLLDFKRVIDNVTDEMIELWVKDLVLVKTFIGLKFQEAILKKVADATGLDYSLSSPEQESRGIDGVIGNREVSIKPISWRDQVIQRENLQGILIYYQKTDEGLEIEFQPADFQ